MGLVSSSYFADTIVGWVNLVINIAAIILEAWAVIHCAMQRPDAFTALGTPIPKGGWLVILILSLIITLFFGVLGSLFALGLIGLGFTGFYLLQLRSGFRELLEGRW
ncbi:MAG: DUF2516 family protein [Hamadaea sp.]|uniref:DUF2516 family protein n=1 Tax=Hamadaea sp. NPDC050747 TaxID=3155789 RepID=UPI0017F7AB58|nr:DUF2516 family protein [Hamadaea sp.]NUR46821.1 DUF2516 family protein [Hamadaea sp.]NUT06865.1 DUF2516 family protein [Hamadaea sp.]